MLYPYTLSVEADDPSNSGPFGSRSLVLPLFPSTPKRIVEHELLTSEVCSAVEFHIPEVGPLEKNATRSDLADIKPVTCLHADSPGRRRVC